MNGFIGPIWWGWGFCRCSFCRGRMSSRCNLSGEEVFAIGDTPGQLKAMLDNKFADGRIITVFAESDLGKTTEFSATVRIDTPAGDFVLPERGGFCSMCCGNWRGGRNGSA